VYAPAGLRERTYDDMAPWVEWHEVADGDRVTVGSLQLTFSRTDHGPETLAVRVDTPGGERSLGYSADTGPDWTIEALGAGLDLALCEATVPASMEGQLQHLSARQAGESARAAGARRLVLTHLWPTLDADQSRREAKEAFGADVDVAAVDARYEL
jgi:ribonuclease BN (tRNA processing enzyme)